jgi:hypothetical protein
MSQLVCVKNLEMQIRINIFTFRKKKIELINILVCSDCFTNANKAVKTWDNINFFLYCDKYKSYRKILFTNS